MWRREMWRMRIKNCRKCGGEGKYCKHKKYWIDKGKPEYAIYGIVCETCGVAITSSISKADVVRCWNEGFGTEGRCGG
jgi:hypothetical protein